MSNQTTSVKFREFCDIVARLRAPDGCPWDREQTHETLKAPCIEEAAEVICGINILTKTGDAGNLKEELGDLLMQVIMHAQIAEEEGLFTMEDVLDTITEKMIRRHPHVFGGGQAGSAQEALDRWNEIKKKEKNGKQLTDEFLPEAFEEAKELIDVARRRKHII